MVKEEEFEQWQKLTNENIETAIKLLKENIELKKEIERLNSIINELKQKLNLAENILYDYLYKDKKITKELYDSFKGLKGDGSNE